MRSRGDLPSRQSMKRAHRTRKFRRSNFEHGPETRWVGRNTKPWKQHKPERTAA